ncbi:hypothetical protein AZE42_10224 [Rhizopogon vesiculosus]|uniref:Uncharacterized protein n=1 Tax=Rhizopogon vesiculosus TaxID=180088 RepID=A0A1J8QBA1_9AGAM|nr:hypothetical protein AZE42_10224 [Rhizopogon vesiculosus]
MKSYPGTSANQQTIYYSRQHRLMDMFSLAHSLALVKRVSEISDFQACPKIITMHGHLGQAAAVVSAQGPDDGVHDMVLQPNTTSRRPVASDCKSARGLLLRGPSLSLGRRSLCDFGCGRRLGSSAFTLLTGGRANTINQCPSCTDHAPVQRHPC